MLPPYANQDSGPVQFLSISDEKGRIQVMIDFNNDISEYWQALDVGQCSLHESGKAVQLGVNYAIYAMTH
jgi:lysyl-tRNA synthetase class II